MPNTLGPFSAEEVQQIIALIEKMEQSNVDFLRLESGDLKLTVSKGGYAGPAAEPTAGTAPTSASVKNQAENPPPPAPQVSAAIGAPLAPTATAASRPAPPATVTATAKPDGTLPIPAPIMGRFFAQPEPGAPPFVTLGAEVDEDTTVGVIEVMKVFNAVKAGARGVISAIGVQDGEFVEYGQTLFRLRPSEPAAVGAIAS